MIADELTSKGGDWDANTMMQPDLFQMSDVSTLQQGLLNIADACSSFGGSSGRNTPLPANGPDFDTSPNTTSSTLPLSKS